MPAFGGLHAKLGVLPSNGSNDIAVYKAFFVSQLSVLSKIVQNSSLPPPDGNGKINSLVRLDIPGPVLARLLAYMYPQARGLPFLTLELLEIFCLTGERYGLQTTIQRSHGALFVEAHSPTVLALAILYDLPELVSVALPHFDNPKDRDVTTRPRGWADRISLWEVGDSPWRLAKRLRFAVLVKLIRCETIVQRFDGPYYRWLDVSAEVQRVGADWFDEAAASA